MTLPLHDRRRGESAARGPLVSGSAQKHPAHHPLGRPAVVQGSRTAPGNARAPWSPRSDDRAGTEHGRADPRRWSRPRPAARRRGRSRRPGASRYAVPVRRVDHDRPVQHRVVEHRRRVVGDQHVGGQVEILDRAGRPTTSTNPPAVGRRRPRRRSGRGSSGCASAADRVGAERLDEPLRVERRPVAGQVLAVRRRRTARPARPGSMPSFARSRRTSSGAGGDQPVVARVADLQGRVRGTGRPAPTSAW